MYRAAVVCAAIVALVAACGADDEALVPEDYKMTHVLVRGCRSSSEHDLHKIRVLTAPATAAIYSARMEPFPVGSLIVKEEYDFTDDNCSGELVNWAVMQKTTDGWRWQKVAPDRTVQSENDTRCIGCHAECGVPPDGFDGTCTVP